MATACLCVLACQIRVLSLNFSLNLNGKFSSQTNTAENRMMLLIFVPFPR